MVFLCDSVKGSSSTAGFRGRCASAVVWYLLGLGFRVSGSSGLFFKQAVWEFRTRAETKCVEFPCAPNCQETGISGNENTLLLFQMEISLCGTGSRGLDSYCSAGFIFAVQGPRPQITLNPKPSKQSRVQRFWTPKLRAQGFPPEPGTRSHRIRALDPLGPLSLHSPIEAPKLYMKLCTGIPQNPKRQS